MVVEGLYQSIPLSHLMKIKFWSIDSVHRTRKTSKVSSFKNARNLNAFTAYGLPIERVDTRYSTFSMFVHPSVTLRPPPLDFDTKKDWRQIILRIAKLTQVKKQQKNIFIPKEGKKALATFLLCKIPKYCVLRDFPSYDLWQLPTRFLTDSYSMHCANALPSGFYFFTGDCFCEHIHQNIPELTYM